jgi:hypothetical protein
MSALPPIPSRTPIVDPRDGTMTIFMRRWVEHLVLGEPGPPGGDWIDVAADNSWFAIGSAGGGNWTVGSVLTFAYTRIGKTLQLQVATQNGTWAISSNTLYVLLPGGYAAAAGRYSKGSAYLTNASLPYETCAVQAQPGQAWLAVFRNGQANFPAAAGVTMFLEIALSIG